MPILVEYSFASDSWGNIILGYSKKSRFVDEIMRRVANGQYYTDPFFVTAFVIGLGLSVRTRTVRMKVDGVYTRVYEYTLDGRHQIYVCKY